MIFVHYSNSKYERKKMSHKSNNQFSFPIKLKKSQIEIQKFISSQKCDIIHVKVC